jgi:hypothetical protein
VKRVVLPSLTGRPDPAGVSPWKGPFQAIWTWRRPQVTARFIAERWIRLPGESTFFVKFRFILWKERYLPGKIRWMPPETHFLKRVVPPLFLRRPRDLRLQSPIIIIFRDHRYEHRQFDSVLETSSVFDGVRSVVCEKSGTFVKRVVFL